MSGEGARDRHCNMERASCIFMGEKEATRMRRQTRKCGGESVPDITTGPCGAGGCTPKGTSEFSRSSKSARNPLAPMFSGWDPPGTRICSRDVPQRERVSSSREVFQ